jgi:hypothetical protein
LSAKHSPSKKSDGATGPTVVAPADKPSRRGPDRLKDDKGNVGFNGGERPDKAGEKSSEPTRRREPARPRDTGRQGA